MSLSKPPTLADLRKAGTITSFEIVAAIDAYMVDPASGPYRFASGHSLDITTLVALSPGMAELADRPGPENKTFRNAVAVAVMAARPASPDATIDQSAVRSGDTHGRGRARSGERSIVEPQ